MGTTDCHQCADDKSELHMQRDESGTFKTIKEIQQKFKTYAETNLLSLYHPRCQKAIEQLYILSQFHICDLIIELSCEKKTKELSRLLDEVQEIDLQTLDHLTLIKQFSQIQVIRSLKATNSVYEMDDIRTSMTNQQFKLQKNEGSILKIINKNWIKMQNSSESAGLNVLKTSKLLVIATIQCFDGVGALKKLHCPTKKTPLRLFLEKIQTVNNRFYSRLMVIFIVHPKFEQKFDKQMAKYHEYCSQQLGEDPMLVSPQINFIKVIHQPCYPCMNLKRQIQIVDKVKLKFNYSKGDLIGFILKNKQIQAIMQRYQFIQIANISNILEVMAERSILTYLVNHKQIEIISLAINEQKTKSKNQNLRINKGFIEKFISSINSLNMNNKKCYELTKSFYFRSALLTSRGKSFQALISTRIQSQVIDPSTFHFVRTFEDILYAPLTALVIVQKNEYASSKTPETELSNYCKQILGIKDTQNDQMVQICPQVLYGDRTQHKEISQQLQKLSIGFPLIINKQKIETTLSECPSDNTLLPK